MSTKGEESVDKISIYVSIVSSVSIPVHDIVIKYVPLNSTRRVEFGDTGFIE
jgi:hypothetical protein